MQGLLVFNYSSRCCNNRCISNISINLRANKQRTQLQKRKVMHRNRKNASEQHLLAAWPTQLQHLRQHRSNCNEPLLCIATVFFSFFFSIQCFKRASHNVRNDWARLKLCAHVQLGLICKLICIVNFALSIRSEQIWCAYSNCFASI